LFKESGGVVGVVSGLDVFGFFVIEFYGLEPVIVVVVEFVGIDNITVVIFVSGDFFRDAIF